MLSETTIPSQWSLQDSYPMYIAEFIGTMMYSVTMGIIVSQNSKNPKSPEQGLQQQAETIQLSIGVGFILISMIYAFGHISGAHFNPAITISVWIRKFISSYDAMMFIISQMLGSMIGVFMAYGVTGKYPTINYDNSLGRAFASELIYSFVLCLVVINVATTESQRGNFFYGVAIGLAVAMGTATVYTISGAAFNPAIGTAMWITTCLNDGKVVSYIWLYWVAPVLGSILGGFSFYVINIKEHQQKNFDSQF